MPSNCAVATCKSWAKGVKKRKDLGVSFFRFPKDPAVRAAWVHKCARQDVWNPDTASICSLHFTSEDYDPSYLVKRSLMPNAKPSLKPGVVPSQNIPSHPTRSVMGNGNELAPFYISNHYHCLSTLYSPITVFIHLITSYTVDSSSQLFCVVTGV